MTAAWLVIGAVALGAAAFGAGRLIRRFVHHSGQRADHLADLDDPGPDPHWPEVRRQLRPPPLGWPPQITDDPPGPRTPPR